MSRTVLHTRGRWKFSLADIKKIFCRSDLWPKSSHVVVVAAWNVFPILSLMTDLLVQKYLEMGQRAKFCFIQLWKMQLRYFTGEDRAAGKALTISSRAYKHSSNQSHYKEVRTKKLHNTYPFYIFFFNFYKKIGKK